jgi:hypothetical protein
MRKPPRTHRSAATRSLQACPSRTRPRSRKIDSSRTTSASSTQRNSCGSPSSSMNTPSDFEHQATRWSRSQPCGQPCRARANC